jgi:hypothetical protein
VSYSAITLCAVSQRVFTVVSVYFVIDSVRKLLDTPSYVEISATDLLFLQSYFLWIFSDHADKHWDMALKQVRWLPLTTFQVLRLFIITLPSNVK